MSELLCCRKMTANIHGLMKNQNELLLWLVPNTMLSKPLKISFKRFVSNIYTDHLSVPVVHEFLQ